MIGQAVLLREYMVLSSGNECAIGVALAAWLLGVGLGSFLAGRLCRRTRVPAAVTAALPIGPLFLLVIAALRLWPAWLHQPPGTVLSFSAVAVAALSLLPAGGLFGATLPLAAHTGRVSIAVLYGVEALGALAGGLLYQFVLLPATDPFTALLLPTTALWGAAAAARNRRIPRLLTATGALAGLVLLAAGLPAAWNTAAEHLRWRAGGTGRLLAVRDSPYQHLALAEWQGQTMLYGDGQLGAVFPDPQAAREYAAHLLAQRPTARRILLLGEGYSGLAGALLEYPGLHVTMVEADGSLLNLIESRLEPAESRRLRTSPMLAVTVDDPRRFLHRAAAAKERFDLVCLNTAEPASLLQNRLYTLEALYAVRRVLAVDGVAALRFSGGENYGGGLLARYGQAIVRTVAAVYPAWTAAPGDPILLFAAARNGVVSDDPQVLRERLLGRRPEARREALLFFSLYPEEKTAFLRRVFSAGMAGPLNRDNHPTVVWLQQQLRGWYSSTPQAWLRLVQGAAAPLPLAILFCAAIVFCFRRRHTGGRSPVVFAAFAVGFTALAGEMALLQLYQNLYGHVYRNIGILTAAFMAGLPPGARAAAGVRRPLLATGSIPPAMALLLVLLRLALPLWADRPLGLHLLLGVGLFLLGAGSGLFFPCACRASGWNGPGRQSGRINAADHAGAALGAFLGSAVLLPLLGIDRVLTYIAVLAAGAGLLHLVRHKANP